MNRCNEPNIHLRKSVYLSMKKGIYFQIRVQQIDIDSIRGSMSNQKSLWSNRLVHTDFSTKGLLVFFWISQGVQVIRLQYYKCCIL